MRNQTAADLQKSWNNTSGVARALRIGSLTKAQARKAKKRFERLRAAHADADGSNAILPNISTDSLTVLGRRGGITFGA